MSDIEDETDRRRGDHEEVHGADDIARLFSGPDDTLPGGFSGADSQGDGAGSFLERMGEDPYADLGRALEEHLLWLTSGGRDGSRIRMRDHVMITGRRPVIRNANFNSGDFTDANISGWTFEECDLDNISASNLTADRAKIRNSRLRFIEGESISLVGAEISDTLMNGVWAGYLDISGARLERDVLDGSVLGEILARDARLSDVQANLIIRSGGSIEGAALESCDIYFDARGFDMSGARIDEGRFSGRLTDCLADRIRISGADMRSANWQSVSAEGADLSGCDMRSMRMKHLSGSGLNIEGGRFDGAKLRHCDLSSASLEGVSVDGMTFSNNLLRDAAIQGIVGKFLQFEENEAEEAASLPLEIGRLVWGIGPAKEKDRGSRGLSVENAGLR